MSKQERILTEEELNKVANLINDLHRGRFITDKLHCEVENVIVSHSSLLSANAALSFENLKLKGEVERWQYITEIAEVNADNWIESYGELHQKFEELQKELVAEKAASEIWRRKLHKEAKPND